jgi:Cu-processing system permease protein
MNSIWNIASQEIKDGFKNRWIIVFTLIVITSSLSITLLGSAPSGDVGASSLAINVVSLSSLTIFLLPLMGLMLSYDALGSDVEKNNMILLLSYPITRGQVLIGKFLGHLIILSFSITIGYLTAGITTFYLSNSLDYENWFIFLSMIISSIILGGTFLCIGYLISSFLRDKSMAGGIAIAIWLFFVLIYDITLLGIIVNFEGIFNKGTFNILLLLNPTDVYRFLNLASFKNVANYSGTLGMITNMNVNSWMLFLIQLVWMVIPLFLAIIKFKNKEI